MSEHDICRRIPFESALIHLRTRVDQHAGVLRQNALPAEPGMQLLYIEKRDEALAVLRLGEAQANALSADEAALHYPCLAESVGIDCPSLYEAALKVLERYETWATSSYHLERIRRAAKLRIAEAETVDEALEAYEGIEWPAAPSIPTGVRPWRLHAETAAPAHDEEPLPAFLRRQSGPVPAPDVGRPEFRGMPDFEPELEDIRRRLAALEAAVHAVDRDLPATQEDGQDHAAAVAQLTSWLARLEGMIGEAQAAAREAADKAAGVPVQADPAPPAVPIREAAIARVRAVAAAKRGSLVGTTADERDVQHRLAEIALNARNGNPTWIARLGSLAQARGQDWTETAREIVTVSDRATALTAETAAIEVLAALDIADALDDEVDAVAERHIEAIERVTT